VTVTVVARAGDHQNPKRLGVSAGRWIKFFSNRDSTQSPPSEPEAAVQPPSGGAVPPPSPALARG
jgi:hypothetical protein